MTAANSAAHVSTDLNTAVTPIALRTRRTSLSATFPSRFDNCRSTNPACFARSINSGVTASSRPTARTSSSMATSSSIARRNHGSIRLRAWIWATVMPYLSAYRRCHTRSAFGVVSLRITSSSDGWSGLPHLSSRSQPRPNRFTSRPRRAFWSDSLNVRPMAIVSPTDFICVVSVPSAPGNFSKLNRGTLVTT